MTRFSVKVTEVRQFWEMNPLAAAAIGAEPGTSEFYGQFKVLREIVEPVHFQSLFYQYERYTDKRVLDVGCGNGYILSHFAQYGAHTTGIDLTARGVGLSSRRFQLERLQGDFVQGNAEELPFETDCFDLVLSMGVLHHTPNTQRAVQEIYRVLRPGGLFLIMLYHKNSIVYRFYFPLRKLYRGLTMQEMVNEIDGKDNPLGKVYSKAEMRQLLRGFLSVSMITGCLQESHFVVKALGRMVPRPIYDWLSRHWGWFLYARAHKPG